MSLKINLQKGFNINLKGESSNQFGEDFEKSSYAVKPTDFLHLSRPKLLVDIGDDIKAGTPLFYDKLSDNVMYCSPVSGEITDIIRGDKRRIEEIRILADKKNNYLTHKKFSRNDIENLSREDLINHLSVSGLWPNIIQRPFGFVADTNAIPKSIHISFFDSSPLSPDYNYILSDEKENIELGLFVLSKLTNGKIHLNHNSESIKNFYFEDYQNNQFSGPHPAGNVGVQIHHIDPINKNDIVWTTTPMGLSQIGKLFSKGIYDASKIICLVGSSVKLPMYYRTVSGFSVENLISRSTNEENIRVISGNVLTGTSIGINGYLGFYDNMITVIPEGDNYKFLGWITPVFNKLSFQRAFGLLSFLRPKKKFILDTNTNGELRAFVQSGIFEKVLPMDILPTFLFKSILAKDYDEMEELGIYELIEEDVALCEFIDVSKNELQKLLRQGLNMLKES